MGESHIENHVLQERWGVSTCAMCGATIVLGERYTWMRRNGQQEMLCSLCACDPLPDPRKLTSARRMLEAAWRAEPAWRDRAARASSAD